MVMSVEFPVFILARDSGEIQRFESIAKLQQRLEKIDVENAEYHAWDKNGHPVSLTVQEPVWLRLEAAVGLEQPDLASCLEQLASGIGVDGRLKEPSPKEYHRVYELIKTSETKRHTWLSILEQMMGRR
jgi:hypothetical protein